ncbi:MAG TPA: carboxypeptidase-like regulatory domain-containing protein [Thermoanaerobaculia bacterium]
MRAHINGPRGVAVSVTATRDGAAVTLTCAAEGQDLVCTAPAAQLDLRVAAEGFVPRYLFDVVVPAGGRADLGELALTRGASISGRVAVARRDGDPSGVAVELLGRSGAPLRTTANRRGFFQFAGVPEGTYTVVAKKKGWSLAESQSIDVTSLEEVALRAPLLLQPLARFEMTVSPAADPWGRPWRIALTRRVHEEPVKIAEEPLAADGSWSRAGLESGIYDVDIQDTDRSTHASRIVEIAEGAPPLFITLAHFNLHGKATIDGEPARGWLRFVSNGRVAWGKLDDEGVYHAAIPEEGTWRLEYVPLAQQKLRMRVGEAGLHRPADGADARYDVELPAGRVHGKVVDLRGEPVRARVQVYDSERKLLGTVGTADDGAFELVAIPEGAVFVRASARDADTGQLPHRVDEEQLVEEPLTITLQPKRKVRGVVLSPAGQPVAGAVVHYQSPMGGEVRDVITGPDGEFVFETPHNTELVNISVVSPRFAMKIVAVPADGEARELVLSRSPGLLRLRSSYPPFPVVHRDGARMDVASLLTFGMSTIRMPPEGFVLPLEPGTYSICRSQRSTECVTRTIAAGGEAVVEFR